MNIAINYKKYIYSQYEAKTARKWRPVTLLMSESLSRSFNQFVQTTDSLRTAVLLNSLLSRELSHGHDVDTMHCKKTKSWANLKV